MNTTIALPTQAVMERLLDVASDLVQLLIHLSQLFYDMSLLSYRAGKQTRYWYWRSQLTGQSHLLPDLLETTETLPLADCSPMVQEELVTEQTVEPDLTAVEETAVDYSVMTLKTLRSLAKERQISNSSKAKLIERLSI
jgi:hypothetical protein